MIATFIFTWIGIAIAGHAMTPFIPLISPEPVLSGYVGFYAGIISLAIIPLIMLCWTLFRLIWGFQVNPTFRRSTRIIWGLSFFIFFLTLVFSGRNFVHSAKDTTEIVFDDVDTSKALIINVDRLSHHGDERELFKINIGNAFFEPDGVLFREGVTCRFSPAENGQVSIIKKVSGRGNNVRNAKKSTRHVNHDITIDGNMVKLSDYFKIQKRGKYRGQQIEIDIRVPQGMSVEFENNSRIFRPRELGRKTQTWKMTEKGLEVV